MIVLTTTMSYEFMLFAQHGWADGNRDMTRLANRVLDDKALIISPDLGYIQTWLRIDPLIDRVEAIAVETITAYPDLPIRIIGHSLGGLIWLEVLHRHPEWWSKVHSLVLIGSPVGGADLSRMIDPLNLGLGIAADLGKSRKALAEAIADAIPTLIIAGDIDGGSDGTVPVTCTRFSNAYFFCLPHLAHSAMKTHPAVVEAIKQFWDAPMAGDRIIFDDVIRQLHLVPGMTDSHYRGFQRASVYATLKHGGTIRLWKNLMGIDHVFVASDAGECLYAGFVGWLHAADLRQALEEIKRDYAVSLL